MWKSGFESHPLSKRTHTAVVELVDTRVHGSARQSAGSYPASGSSLEFDVAALPWRVKERLAREASRSLDGGSNPNGVEATQT